MVFLIGLSFVENLAFFHLCVLDGGMGLVVQLVLMYGISRYFLQQGRLRLFKK